MLVPEAGVPVASGTGVSVTPGTGVCVASGAGVSVTSGSCASGFGLLPNLSILTILENFPYVIWYPTVLNALALT